MKKILSSDDLCVSEQEAFIALKTWLDKDFDNRKIHITGLLSCIRMEQLHPKVSIVSENSIEISIPFNISVYSQ